MSAGEREFALQCLANNLAPVREYRFHPERRWRFDFAWPEHSLAVEVEGGMWVNGRHTRGSGAIKDCEKYNAAALLGWTVLRYPTAKIMDGTAVDDVLIFLRRAS